MNARTTGGMLLAAALAAGVLSGCVPPDTGTAQGGSTSGVIACDPKGFGPLSGCGSTQGKTPSTLTPDEGVSADRITLAARHELGHVVVVRALDGTVDGVEIHSDGSGETTYHGIYDTQAKITVKLAGAVAAGTPDGAGKDFAEVEALTKEFPIRDRGHVVAAARRDAERIVAEHRAEIDAEATQLAKTGRLS